MCVPHLPKVTCTHGSGAWKFARTGTAWRHRGRFSPLDPHDAANGAYRSRSQPLGRRRWHASPPAIAYAIAINGSIGKWCWVRAQPWPSTRAGPIRARLSTAGTTHDCSGHSAVEQRSPNAGCDPPGKRVVRMKADALLAVPVDRVSVYCMSCLRKADSAWACRSIEHPDRKPPWMQMLLAIWRR